MQTRFSVLLLGALVGLQVSAAGYGIEFDPVKDAAKAASSYFARTSCLTYRMWQPDGVVREFDYRGSNAEWLTGADGWQVRMRGDRTFVRSGAALPGGPVGLVFRNGRLVEYTSGQRTVTFPDVEMPLRAGSVESLWPDACGDKFSIEDVIDPWKGKRRLRLWFKNPNRMALFLVELLLLLAAGLALTRSRAWRVVGIVAAVVLAIALLKTGSRGGVLALVLSGAFLAAFHFRRRLLTQKGLQVLAIVALAAVVLFAGFAGRRMKRGPNRGDTLRMELTSAAPQMMVDAPGGWGFIGSARAYVDWYQPLNRFWFLGSLVNDHLTQLVRFGWPMRAVYVFLWSALMILLVVGAGRRKISPLPAALWIAFLVTTSLNRVMESGWLWLVPVGATFWDMRRFRTFSRKAVLASVAVAAIVAVLVTVLFACAGSGRRTGCQIHADGRRVLVHGMRPQCWIADDGWVLGGTFAPMEIRLHFQNNPQAPSVGYVKSVLDLPSSGVRQLILGGRAGWDFLVALNEGSFPEDFNMPEEIVFVSPPFPPSAIPELMLKNLKVRIVIGEFAAAFFEEYRKPPTWVEVVRGAELYIPDWTSRLLSPR